MPWTSFETERKQTAAGSKHIARVANEADKAVKGVRVPQIDPRDRPGTHRPHLSVSPDRYTVEYDSVRGEVILTFDAPTAGEVAL